MTSPGQVLGLDHAVGEVLVDLDEDAALRDAGDDAVERLADVLCEELQHEELAQLALGILGVLLGAGDVAADLDQRLLVGAHASDVAQLAAESLLVLVVLRARSCRCRCA